MVAIHSLFATRSPNEGQMVATELTAGRSLERPLRSSSHKLGRRPEELEAGEHMIVT